MVQTHTVGLIGINGNVGIPLAQCLIQAANEQKINLVLFHRKDSKTPDFKPVKNIELRVFSFDDSPEKIYDAVKDINIFVSAVSTSALAQEAKLVEALGKSPEAVTYMPALYSTTWNETDSKDELIGSILASVDQGVELATKLGLGMTKVYTGVFDLFYFELGYLGSPLKGNTVHVNEAQLKNRVPITTMQHLGEAITNLVTSDPQSIKNKEYSVVSFWPTGEELVKLYTKINGKQAEVKDYTAADREELRKKPFGAIQAGYRAKWAENSYEYEIPGQREYGLEYRGPTIEEVAKRFA